MQVDQRSNAMVRGLHDAQVEFVVVGGLAAVLQAAPILTEDLDIVHRRTPDNVARLLAWLLDHHAYNRSDLANRNLAPNAEALLGRGHINLQTDLGKLDVLCELAEGEGYDEILTDTVVLQSHGFPLRVLGLERLIAVKGRAGRPKDRAVMHVLIATLDEQRKKAASAPPEKSSPPATNAHMERVVEILGRLEGELKGLRSDVRELRDELRADRAARCSATAHEHDKAKP